MDSLIGWLTFGTLLTGGVFLFFWISKNLRSMGSEFAQSSENRFSNLRVELGNQLQTHRQDLQVHLQLCHQASEKQIQGLDQKLEGKVKELQGTVQKNLEQNLKEGFVYFDKIQTSLKQTENQLSQVAHIGTSIHELNSLLKLPHLRGGFGEIALERLLEDGLPPQSFELQYRIDPNSTERVDAVIHFPETKLPIDAKFPREQFEELYKSSDPEMIEGLRKKLFEVIRVCGRSIKEKYIRPEFGTTDMALLFVPSETLYFEILRSPKLWEELRKFKVFAVSPHTLSISLQSISAARVYYDMAKGVESTLEMVRKSKSHFDNFEKRFLEIGTQIDKASHSFHTAQTHLSRYSGSVGRLLGKTIASDTPITVEPGEPEQMTQA